MKPIVELFKEHIRASEKSDKEKKEHLEKIMKNVYGCSSAPEAYKLIKRQREIQKGGYNHE